MTSVQIVFFFEKEFSWMAIPGIPRPASSAPVPLPQLPGQSPRSISEQGGLPGQKVAIKIPEEPR